MEHQDILVQARITPEVFREFAVFDTLYRNKRYRRPLAFALMMAAFALACFLLRRRADQAVFIGVILLIIGLGLPVVYILSFLYSVRAKAKQLRLGNSPVAYTVSLTPAKVIVTDGKQKAEYPWEAVKYAYRLQHSICLYASESRAYLLPAGERETEEERRWAVIAEHIPAGRRKDLRK